MTVAARRPQPVACRTGRASLIVVALITALSLGGCSAMLMGEGRSAGRPIGSAGASSEASRGDEQIVQIIRGRFAAEPELASARLSVACVNGVVSLRGQVSNYALRDRAVRLAGDVSGVERVVNQIGINR